MVVTFHKMKEEPRPEIVEKNMYAISIRNKIDTLLTKDPQCVVINELGPQEDFVKHEKPKLQGASVNVKLLKDLEKLLEENSGAFAEDETQIGTTPVIKMSIETGDHRPIAKHPTLSQLNILTGQRKKLTNCSKLV